jgi:hypothetical protein
LFVGFPLLGVTVIAGAIISHAPFCNTPQVIARAATSGICPRCLLAISSLVRRRN